MERKNLPSTFLREFFKFFLFDKILPLLINILIIFVIYLQNFFTDFQSKLENYLHENNSTKYLNFLNAFKQ